MLTTAPRCATCGPHRCSWRTGRCTCESALYVCAFEPGRRMTVAWLLGRVKVVAPGKMRSSVPMTSYSPDRVARLEPSLVVSTFEWDGCCSTMW